MLKKLSILFLTLATILTLTNAGLAVGGVSFTNGEVQELQNGDIENGTTGWEVFGSSSLSASTANPYDGDSALRITTIISGDGAKQFRTVTAGLDYRLSGYARGDGTRIPIVVNPWTGAVWWTGTSSTEWQYFDIVATPLSTTMPLLRGMGGAGWVEFDNVTATEYKGETVNGEVQELVDGDMEASGTSEWTDSSAATSTKETSSPHSGSRYLRVTNFTGSGNAISSSQDILTVGKTYKVTGYARSDGQYLPAVSIKTSISDYSWQGVTTTLDWQYFEFTDVAEDDLSLGATNFALASYVEFDDVTVTEYKGELKDGTVQMLHNGDFENGTTGWGAGNGATIATTTGYFSNGGLKITSTGNTTNIYASASNAALTNGKKYKTTGRIKCDGVNAGGKIYYGGGSKTIGTGSTSWEYFEVVFTSSIAEPLRYYISDGNTGSYCEFDDIILTQID